MLIEVKRHREMRSHSSAVVQEGAMDRRQLSLGLAAGALMLSAGARNGLAATDVCVTCPTRVEPTVPPPPVFGGLDFEWIKFLKDGELISAPSPALLQDPTITDFIVISHGWKTDAEGAKDVYEPLLRNVSAGFPAGRKYGILGVQWPSKPFRDAQDNPINATVARQRTYAELSDEELQQAIQKYAEFTGGDASRLQAAAQTLAREGREQDYWALADEIRASLAEPPRDDPELLADYAGFVVPGGPNRRQRRVTEALGTFSRRPLSFNFDASVARAQGMDPDQYCRYRGLKAFIFDLFNFPTYYEMKRRAGVVGRGLAKLVLAQVEASAATRVHLIGHSFGARLVASAAYHSPERSKLRSLTLLQGAFSHYGFAEDGAFAGAYRKVSGPTLITHTHNDEAVAKWYAIASAAAGDTSRKRRRLGGVNDRHGGIGANGALNLPYADVAALIDTNPAVFAAGKVHNMNCSNSVRCHMDVTNTRVAEMVAAALAV
jgi:hypothetical protein